MASELEHNRRQRTYVQCGTPIQCSGNFTKRMNVQIRRRFGMESVVDQFFLQRNLGVDYLNRGR